MKEREGKPGMRFQNSLINFQFSIKNSLRNRTGFQNFSFFPFGSDKLVFSSFFFYNCVPIEDWALVRAHNKEKREWKRDLLPNEEEIVTSVTSHGWLKEKIRWCGQALLGSFLFIISQVLPTVTNDFLFHFLFNDERERLWSPAEGCHAHRKGNESLAGTKKKEKMNAWSIFPFFFIWSIMRSFISLLLLCADWPGLW